MEGRYVHLRFVEDMLHRAEIMRLMMKRTGDSPMLDRVGGIIIACKDELRKIDEATERSEQRRAEVEKADKG